MIKKGLHLINGRFQAQSKQKFKAINAHTKEYIDQDYAVATVEEINQACKAAHLAYLPYHNETLEKRAAFLETIASEIENIVDLLVDEIDKEAALPEGRVRGECARTCGQLRLFSAVIRRGDFLQARIDTALPERKPLPRCDIRQYNISIGPVAVFGASNFPLAFSVAGGDTASALAAGSPVVFRAHPAHPGTSELVAKAISGAIDKCNIHPGVFSLLQGEGYEIGSHLVQNPYMKAVAFTGSLQGGRALFDLVAQRNHPIPVYAEMGSVNPVFILPEAMDLYQSQLPEQFVTSLTLGVGQFCTNPGMVIALKSDSLSVFENTVSQQVQSLFATTMLNPSILKGYLNQVEKYKKASHLLAHGDVKDGKAPCFWFKTTADEWVGNDVLQEEVFGPASLLVEAKQKADLLTIADHLEGQLTATLWATENDLKEHEELIASLLQKVGRLLFNGFPTGVEVCDAMTHGGVYPASTDSKSTSVGSRAIERFLRPVSFQDCPNGFLPDALKKGNPLNLLRLVNGKYKR